MLYFAWSLYSLEINYSFINTKIKNIWWKVTAPNLVASYTYCVQIEIQRSKVVISRVLTALFYLDYELNRCQNEHLVLATR